MLRRGTALLLTTASAWAAAGAEPARAAGGAFAVSVEGTQTTVVTRVRRSTGDLGCTVTRSDLDRQTLRFATRRPGRLLVRADGRAAPARAPATVQATGSRLRRRTVSGPSPACDVATLTSERPCGPIAVAAQTVVRLRERDLVALSGSLDRRSDRSRCAPDAAPARPFLVASEGRFRASHLDDPTAARISLRGSMRFSDHLAGGIRRITTVRWTIVLTRAD